ncbi:MAG: metal ABC transporter ATP-binding protein [Alphaproteobacteria bacterium]|nr:metal ABC transporter ATP-binding protein [Alphaproteobacteria bacterium]
MSQTPAIGLTDLIVTYRRVPAVHHVTGVFAPGSLTAIAGPNGAGKSTLLKAIMGLLPISDGRIDRGGMPAKSFAYLPQVPEIDRTFPISVLQTVLMGAWPRAGAFRAVSKVDRECARACIANVGLAGYEHAPIAALSAGQWHRALFARLILQDARVILLDEPFAALDERTTADLMKLVHGWHGEGRTVIAVLHDVAFIRRHFAQTLLIARELVAWGPTSEALSDENIERARAMTDRWAREQNGTHEHHHHDHAGHAHA